MSGLPFAVFDEFGVPADDRVQDYVHALRVDAERYRKWRAAFVANDVTQVIEPLLLELNDCWSIGEIDAAIDKARATPSGEQT